MTQISFTGLFIRFLPPPNRYEGEYVDGKRNGEGLLHYPDGSTYEGHWNGGDKSGVGTYTYANGDTYEGEWKDNQKHGKGIYTYKSSGTQFKGNTHHRCIPKYIERMIYGRMEESDVKGIITF